ncbi:MAG TPA: preprotein translocase subunit YajC [Kineosporiaceae bacterium]|nr:preprotein translocase subunit YajC [Kineosporiaceae bacterium]
MDSSILLLVVTVGLFVVLIMGQRRQRRDQHSVQSQLTPGAEVMTAGGLYATVVSVDDAVVVLRTGPGQESRWDRRAVARVMPPADSRNSSPGEPSGDPDLADEDPSGPAGRSPADGEGPEPGGSSPSAGDPPPDRG